MWLVQLILPTHDSQNHLTPSSKSALLSTEILCRIIKLASSNLNMFRLPTITTPSKGVQIYSYVAAPGCAIEFSVPGQTLTRDRLREFNKDRLEIDKKNIKGTFNFTGTFSFRVLRNGQEIVKEFVNVNVMTGNLESGSMKSMPDQNSTVTNEIIVCFGFYDSGPGLVNLPSLDQCWVTVTPNYSGWMGAVAPRGSPQAGKSFSKFMLPAAHDIGMNSMQTCDAVLASTALVDVLTTVEPVFAKVAGKLSHDVAKSMAPNIVSGLAITQKDSLMDILRIGARYFEFRPAYLHKAIRAKPPVPDVPYFSHSAIPGMAYIQFLHDVVKFLVDNDQEIVVVQNRWDGVPADCARPTDDDLANNLRTALERANGSLVAGGLDDMRNLTIAQLRDQKKRLIIFMPSDSYSTYTDEGNATLSGDSIVAQFQQITPERQAGKPFTNLQCQATATNISDVVAYSVLAANASSSPMLATKPICDSKTLPWIAANGGRLDPNQLVVVMNDFIDGATADVAIEWSKKRLA